MVLEIEGNIRFISLLIKNVLKNVLLFFYLKIYLSGVFFQESDKVQNSWTFQKLHEPYMVFYANL